MNHPTHEKLALLDMEPTASRKRSRSSAHRWPKRLLSPIAVLLRTGDPTDTVDRLFKSQHVNDLRLIVAAAFVLTLLLFTIALVAAVSYCSIAWTHADTSSLPGLVVFLAENGGVHFLAVFTPALAVFGAILAWAYQVGSARLGVVDLFACEIDTLCRVITIVGMVRSLIERYSHRPPQTPTATGTGSTATSSSFSSQENYFPILDSNAQDLQTLEANVVINITAFYTYMKAVRDTFRRIADAQTLEGQRDALQNLIYMVFLALESGRRATDDLVEFEPTHTERTVTMLLSELDAYTFLRGQYQTPGEVHHDHLILRGPLYMALVKKLNDILRSQAPALLRSAPSEEPRQPTYAERQWSAALQSLPALNERLETLRSQFPLDCVPVEDQIGVGPSLTAKPDRSIAVTH